MGKYNIDETIAIGDAFPDPAAWASGVGFAVNDLDSRVGVLEGSGKPALLARTNLFQDPLATATTRFSGATNYGSPALVTNFPVPTDLQPLLGSTTTAVRSTRTATGAARINGPVLGASMPAAGEAITVYLLARAGKAMSSTVTARAQVANSTGAVSLGSLSLTTDPQLFVLTGNTFSGTAGTSSGLAVSIPTSAVDATDWVEITLVGIELGTVAVTAAGDEKPVYGSRPATSRATYAFTGTANDSPSTQTPIAAGAGSSSGSGTAFGFVLAEDQGVKGAPITDKANWATSLPDNSTAWPRLLAYAHDNGVPIRLRPDRAYDMRGFQSENQNVVIQGGGTLVTRQGLKADGYYANITHYPLASNFNLTVSSIATVSLPGNSGTPDGAEVHHALTLASAANLQKFAAEDVWRIMCDSRYIWDTYAGAAGNAWKAEQFDVMGILLPTSGNTAQEGDTIVGNTSGATGVVGSVVADGRLVLKTLTGTFTTTETYKVGSTNKGTLAGVGRVLVRGQLEDTYSGTMGVSKMRSDLTVQLDIVLDVVGNPESTVGSASGNQRQNALNLWGVVRPTGTILANNGWGPLVFVASCDRPQFRLDVTDHVNNASENPDNAVSTENAYGYGFEVVGSTRGGIFRGTGTRMRHWFTTNPLGRTSYPGGTNDIYQYFTGAVRKCDVSADVWASWAAALDNHIGAYDLYYHDSTIDTSGVAAGRFYAGKGALQNRSINTRYEDIWIKGGASNGFIDLAINKDWGMPHVTRLTRVRAEDIWVSGVYANDTTPLAANSIEFEDCVFEMSVLSDATVGASGSRGIDMPACNMLIRGLLIKNASFAVANIRSGLSGAVMMVDGLKWDQRASSFAAPYFLRLASAGLSVWLNELGVYESGGTWTTNRGAVHVVSGSPTIRRTSRPWSFGNTTALPVLTSGSAAATVAVIDGYA